ncbi:MAG: hypothetical protein HUU32_13235 [Calditrichaceae bacterium]|nr:hypothetical protein [Calditrichia bacterium]NUQ42351.1 hypothetical protein [Calditrichaceae bacterium]
MGKNKKNITQFAICIENSGYPASLELFKVYRVLPDEEAAADGDLRVIDESGEDYLYPAQWFVFIEPPKAVRERMKTAARPMASQEK